MVVAGGGVGFWILKQHCKNESERALKQRALEIWFTAVGLLFAAFGIVMAVWNESEIFWIVFNPIIESSFWPAEVPPEAQLFRSWVYGAWGGTVAGFGLLLAATAGTLFQDKHTRLRHGVMAALTLWFVVDSTASLVHGAWGNALFINLPAYVALGLPILLSENRRR